jgi:ankyrin repeat protein
LHWACINNRRAIADLLLTHGADINYSGGKLNEIAIQWAVRNEKFTSLVQYLIEKGSNLSHKSVSGMDTLHVACRSGSMKMVFLLISGGSCVDTIDVNGDTPLYWCLKNQGDIDTSDLQRLLLRLGADGSLKDGEGNNAFHLIAYSSQRFTDEKFALAMIDKIDLIKKKFGDDLLGMKNDAGTVIYIFIYMFGYISICIYVFI